MEVVFGSCSNNNLLFIFQCLKAEDIASAVIFVLSAPSHVQVCSPSLPLVCAMSDCFDFLVFHSGLQIGDVQMRPVEQVS